MKKYIAAILVLVVLLFTLASCIHITTVTGEMQTYEITSEIHSLDIEIGAADFIIEHGDSFYVESNMKHLSVSESNGVLSIVEKQKNGIFYGVHSTDAVLKLYLPSDIVFETVDITTGAALLTADSLSANSVELKLGAGKVQIECLNAYSDADIEGGTGQINIENGILNDLDLEMGMGELNLSAALLGNCDLSLGVGASNLTLNGSKDDYKVDIEKGLGSISVDGENVSDFGSSGNGKNSIKIQGGVGAVNVEFQAE